jgi:hypothetical protein
MNIGHIDNDKLLLQGCGNGLQAEARSDGRRKLPVNASASNSGVGGIRENRPNTVLAHLTTMLSQLAQRGI